MKQSILLFVALSFLSQRCATQSYENSCSSVRYPPPSVRLPPSGGYQGHNFGAWSPPPAEHLYGIHHVTHTSDKETASNIVNLRTERYPVYPDDERPPAGSQVEIDSWSTCANSTDTDCKDPEASSTSFGHNLPLGAQGPTDKRYTAAWMYNATGSLAGVVGTVHAVLAWGRDYDGFDYFAEYMAGQDVTSNDVCSIVIASRNKEGINRKTYICLSSSLKQLFEELGDQQLSEIVSRLQPLHSDHRRDDEGPVECDRSCVDNSAFDTSPDQTLQQRALYETQTPLSLIHTETTDSRNRRDHGRRMPWWGFLTIGLVFGIPTLGSLCIAVPIALCKGHRRRKLIRAQKPTMRAWVHGQNSSVAEPEMVHVA